MLVQMNLAMEVLRAQQQSQHLRRQKMSQRTHRPTPVLLVPVLLELALRKEDALPQPSFQQQPCLELHGFEGQNCVLPGRPLHQSSCCIHSCFPQLLVPWRAVLRGRPCLLVEQQLCFLNL